MDSPDRPEGRSPETTGQQRSLERFLDLAQEWVVAGLEQLSRQGISLKGAIRVAHHPDLVGKVLGGFKSQPQMLRQILEHSSDTGCMWELLFAESKLSVSREAVAQIMSVERGSHPLRAVAETKDEQTIFTPMAPLDIHVRVMQLPQSHPHLRFELLKSLWAIVEVERGLSPDPDIGTGLEKWAVEQLMGTSSDFRSDSPDDTLYALHTRVSARLAGDVLSQEAQPLQAALVPEARARIAERYGREISPRITALNRIHLEEQFSGIESFSWLKSEPFKNFRHRPSPATFCEGLRAKGFVLLAEEIERQPDACAGLISRLVPRAAAIVADELEAEELVRARPEIEALLAQARGEIQEEVQEDADIGELEETIRGMIDYWTAFRSGEKEFAEKLRDDFAGKPCEISVENVRARLEELREFTGQLVGAKVDYEHGLEQLLTYLELEGTEGFY